MVRAWSLLVALVSAALTLGAQDAASVRITSPVPGTLATGVLRLDATISAPESEVSRLSFFVDGQVACALTRAPFTCSWDAGDSLRERHVRAVAYLKDGRRLVDNMRTGGLAYTERVYVDAIQVPVIVTDDGRFVRGLRPDDFRVLEDGVPQSISGMISENVPLDLILAIDVSGSMEEALPEVKTAVRGFLSRLRAGDAATMVAFNDTAFIIAQRETDQKAREEAIDLLTSWGGTALYDATLKSLELVSRQLGRKGVVVFTDGDDRDSLARRETAMSRVQASDAMLYAVAFGRGSSMPALRKSLDEFGRTSGGRTFFARTFKELDRAFADIIDELTHQYVLSYSSSNDKRDGRWRNLKVEVRGGKYDIRAREGYRAPRA